MEHRWGTRKTLDVGVKLYIEGKLPAFGRILNASSSGAYIALGAALPIMTRVHVALGWDTSKRCHRCPITAYVVRTDVRGIGIEWQEFAPVSVRALIDALDALPSQRVRRAAAGGEPPLLPRYRAPLLLVKQPAAGAAAHR
jgi:hypothetical protein